ncbi:MAG: glycosyltransferase family 39 protein [Phycisphaerales bacterium]|jgi:4-amino-4-deoxy-L-arabinose transferase-like glycosyltransferase|nr:glycosyltransferase family 39 protein [Phycisphaerales bacterium]
MAISEVREHGFAPWARAWPATIALVGIVLVARLVYLAAFSPYALIEDEAFYWLWSQHPAWSYYTKGPGIALTIGASTSVLGNTEFGVRALAPVFAAALSLAAAAMARDVTRDGRAGFCAAVLVTLAPGLAVAPLLMTIDVPYMACWALAAWSAWHAIDPEARRGRARWWMLCGAALGAGFLFKYTILLLLPGIMLGAWVARRHARASGGEASGENAPARHTLGLALGAVLLLACMTPVVVWNVQHEWPTLRHLLGHLGMSGGDMTPSGSGGWRYDPRWTLEFVGIQIALAGPALLLVPLAMRRGASRDARERAGRWFLLCCAMPIVVFYLLVTLKAEAEGNWALGALCTLLPLGGIAARDGLDARRASLRAWLAMPVGGRPKWGKLRKRPESWGQILWDWSVGVGLVVTLVGARIDLLARVPVVGERVPIGRLVVGRTVAGDVAPLVERVAHESNGTVLVISQHYGRAAQLAFYLPGELARRGVPRDAFALLCGSSRLGGRTTDFDFWPETDVDDPRWLGRDGVCLGATTGQWREVFERVEDIGPLPGDHKKRTAVIGRGFEGFRPSAIAREGAR